jgi:hypothetical protein
LTPNYPLARNLVMLTIGVGCEVIVVFAVMGGWRSFTITLEDFAVKPFAL